MEEPEPGDRGVLAGLRSRPDLNGRRVEVRGPPAPGKDGCPRFPVRLLFGVGAGTGLAVRAANLDLDKDRVLDPAMQTLVAAMQALAPGAPPPEKERRDWAGLPIELLAKIAETHIAQTEAGWVAYLREWGNREEYIQEQMEERKRDGNCCLFVFALVCKGWREAQLKVGGRLRTRALSDVVLPGRVELAKWGLAEGCPRESPNGFTLAIAAAQYGRPELARWLCQEQGFSMDRHVMNRAAGHGNLELVQWLRDEGCPWGTLTTHWAVAYGRVEVLRWLRENGCPWTAAIRDEAAEKLGYTDGYPDDFSDLVEEEDSEDEYGYEDSDEFSDDE